MKPTSFSIYTAIFGIRLKVFAGTAGLTEDGQAIDGRAECFPDKMLITLKFASAKPGPGLIAHEALHAVQFAEKLLQTDFDCETAAYLLEYWVDQISRRLK